jgi:hypothetical protein
MHIIQLKFKILWRQKGQTNKDNFNNSCFHKNSNKFTDGLFSNMADFSAKIFR